MGSLTGLWVVWMVCGWFRNLQLMDNIKYHVSTRKKYQINLEKHVT